MACKEGKLQGDGQERTRNPLPLGAFGWKNEMQMPANADMGMGQGPQKSPCSVKKEQMRWGP